MLESEAYAELERVLNDLIPTFRWSGDINLKLERIKMLVELLGHPEQKYPVVHVGGTSGKGTVAAMVAATATAHGLRTGLHLSPYVETLTETWQIDGGYVRPSRVLDVARSVIDASMPIEGALPSFGAPSYFEIKVATAFQLFAEENVDIAVIEVGLGGARDATNVLGPGLQVLTNVGLDHTDRLGNTVEEIATDKVQIFKPQSAIVSGVSQPSVKEIVRNRAREVGSPLYLLDDDIRYETPMADQLEVTFRGEPLFLRVPASWLDFQRRNAVLAVAASRLCLPSFDSNVASKALAAVRLPGRLERLSEAGRTVILDGAHNPEKISTTAKYLRTTFPNRRCVGVVALKDTKDAEAVLDVLAGILNAVVFTTFTAELWESMSPEHLAALLADREFRGPIELERDSTRAFEIALGHADPDDIIVVTGSLYLAGNLRSRWFPIGDEIVAGASYRL